MSFRTWFRYGPAMPTVMNPIGATAGVVGRDDLVHAQLAGLGQRDREAVVDLQLPLPRPRRQQHRPLDRDRARVQREPLLGAERRPLVRPALDRPAAVGVGDRADVADEQPGRLAQLEAQVDPVLELLGRAGFDDGHAEVLEQEPAVGRHLRAVAPRVLAADADRPAVGVGPGQVAQRQRVGRHVRADDLERHDAAAAGHLAAVQGRGAQGLVVGLERPDALGLEQVGQVAHQVEEAGHGRARVAGQQVDAAVGLEGAFDEEFVAGEDLPAGFGQEAGIGRHVGSAPRDGTRGPRSSGTGGGVGGRRKSDKRRRGRPCLTGGPGRRGTREAREAGETRRRRRPGCRDTGESVGRDTGAVAS